MGQEGLLAPRAYPRDLLQWAGADGFCPPFAVAADGETMGFIAQPLEVIEHGTFRIEAERRLTSAVEMLPPRLALDALGDSHDHDIVKSHLCKRGMRGIELRLAAVDQHEVRPFAPFVARRAFAGIAHEPSEAPREHFAHHRDIVA